MKQIDSITPIEGADAIETAHIGGWTAVVRKGEFSEGQQVFYFETDSMLPVKYKTFEFLKPRGTKIVDGEEYHRLKAMRLRGVMSDGLVLPVTAAEEFLAEDAQDPEEFFQTPAPLGEVNYSNLFRVIKYEDPILAKLGGKMTHFPDWITKTDEERIQNLPNLVKYIAESHTEGDWFATEKIDGTSCTIWGRIKNGIFENGVCSRNYGLEEEEDNTYWKIARTPLIEYCGDTLSPLDYLKVKCIEHAREIDGTNEPSFVLQGEIYGEGIQNNPLGVKGQEIRFYNLVIDGKFVSQETLREKFGELMGNWVPVHQVSLDSELETIIAQPDGVKTLVPGANKDAQIEGFVWRNSKATELAIPKRKTAKDIDWSKIPKDRWHLVQKSLDEKVRASFKAISDKYRLKHQD